jgi:hypothetical protein
MRRARRRARAGAGRRRRSARPRAKFGPALSAIEASGHAETSRVCARKENKWFAAAGKF